MRSILLCVVLLFAREVSAATFVVNSTADTAGTTCSTTCTLRQAIGAANLTTAADTISFSFPIIGGFERLIQPATPLPTITQPLTINGYSVIAARENDDPVVSNAQLRIRIDGVNAGATTNGLSVCSSNVTIQGLSVTRFGRAGISAGANLCGTFANVRILGNFVGLATSGSGLAANTLGVECLNTPCTIGGGVAERNVITAQAAAVLLSDGVAGTIVAGNLIGTDKSGQLDRGANVGVFLGNQVSGVRVGSASAPNRIRFSGKGIATAAAAGSDNQLQTNHIGDSDEVGIDLGNDGVTPNDANDVDTGPNALQNFPVVTAASRTAGGLTLSGTLDIGHPGTLSYQIAVYAGSACDTSGHGEGERHLGTVARNISSTVEGFSFTLATTDPLPPGTVVTTTATRAGVGTSEFSACLPLDPPPLVVNSADDVGDGACNAAHCSLRDALVAANAQASGVSIITFAIPPLDGTGEILIQPASPLPTLVRSVLIDGYSQPGTAVNTDPEFSNARLRIRLDGTNAGSATRGLAVCSPDVTIRGLSITRFVQSGIFVGVDSTGVPCGTFDDVRIAGNFLGLDAAGDFLAANAAAGVSCSNSPCAIGGSIAERNVIAGGTSGVRFSNGGAAGSRVTGNLFGTDKTGQLDRGGSEGVTIGAFAGIDIGVGSPSAPNRIRFYTRGISLGSGATSGSELAFNSISDSDTIAIDLGLDGVTPNDPDDADAGANGLQNFPVLVRAERVAGTLFVQGSLDVQADASNVPFTIALYANAGCDASGHGEAAIPLGSAVVNLTQDTGEGFAFTLDTTADLVANPVITATATSATGTSEVSACIVATDPPPGIAVDTSADSVTPDGGCDVTGDGNACTLREAITLANARVGADTIRFAIPGAGPHAITPAALLPVITQALTIDGYTEEGAAPNGAATGSDAVLMVELRMNGLTSALRTCTTDLVSVRGLAFNSTAGVSLDTRVNDAANCTAVGTLDVQGCWFGMSATGAPLVSSAHVSANETRATIGGAGLASRNVFANALSTGFGVRIQGGGAGGSRVDNNVFGRTVDPAQASPNGAVDLALVDVASVDVGGTAPNAFHATPVAILVTGSASDRNSFWRNSFSDHAAAAAVDLSGSATPDGISANDVDDADSGANDGQNAPLLTAASAAAGSATIEGTLDVPAGIAAPLAYRLAFYESGSCSDASGAGAGREGQILLGSVLQDFSSAAEGFSVTLPVPEFEPGRFLTATATHPDGSTSELSNCLVPARSDPLFADGFEE